MGTKKSSSEGYAIAAIVLGSLSLMLFWLPYIGFGFSFLAFVFAAVALLIAFQQHEKPIIVYIALGVSLLVMVLSARVTLKANEVLAEWWQNAKFLIEKTESGNTIISTDCTKIRIIFEDNNTLDSLHVEFDDLEKIMNEFEDTLNVKIYQ
jgi:hypothetical protein